MRRFLAIGLVALPAVIWTAVWLLGHSTAGFVSSLLGERLVRMGDGKFGDPVVFIENRLTEAAILVTLLCVFPAIILSAVRFSGRFVGERWRWTIISLLGFVGVNVCLKVAMATCLFWLFFWNGKGSTNNLTQYYIKLLLLPEQKAPVKLVFAGSSQMLAQVDAAVFNRLSQPRAFATGLQFPGNRSFELCLLDDDLEDKQVDAVVCYLSELNFFGSGFGPGFSTFFGFDDLPQYSRLGGQLGWSRQDIGYGLLGSAMPVFRLRGPLSERVLGRDLADVAQNRRDEALEVDLAKRAVEAAKAYRDDDQAKFQIAAMREFVRTCRERGRKVVLCCGQLNPVLAAQLSADLRPKFLAILEELAREYNNVVLVRPEDLPVQRETDYDDLTHVNEAARARFTSALAETLRPLFK